MRGRDGRHEAMPFSTFEEIVRDAATMSVSFHHEKEGARQGLPPDVLTVLFGVPEDGLWWNVRRAELPEENVYRYDRPTVDDRAMAMAQGLITRTHGRRDILEAKLAQMTKPVRTKLYDGWRPVLFTMLKKGVLRRTARLDEWLGYADTEQAKPQHKIQRHEVSPVVREALVDASADDDYGFTPIPGA